MIGTPSRIVIDADTLPRILSEKDVSTAGFVASNPVVSRWQDHFDVWWNGPSENGNADSGEGSSRSVARKAIDHLLLRPHLTGDETFRRAHEWWRSEDDPKFLWIHLMEPHGPYLPGIGHGLRAGIVRTYLSLFASAKHSRQRQFRRGVSDVGAPPPEGVVRSVRPGLRPAVDQLGSQVRGGRPGRPAGRPRRGVRARPPDTRSPVRRNGEVPFLTNGRDGLFRGDLVRQLDFAPTILDALDIERPEGWMGTVHDEDFEPQPMIGSLSRYDMYWTGVRSRRWKYVKTYSEDGLQNEEVYNLEENPEEEHGRSPSDLPDALSDCLTDFEQSKKISEEITEGRRFIQGLDDRSERRLMELGYL